MYLTPNNNKHFYDNLLQPFRTINSINKEYVFLWPVKNYHQTPPETLSRKWAKHKYLLYRSIWSTFLFRVKPLFDQPSPQLLYTNTIFDTYSRNVYKFELKRTNPYTHTHTLKSNTNSEISKIFLKPLIKHRHFNQIRFMF